MEMIRVEVAFKDGTVLMKTQTVGTKDIENMRDVVISISEEGGR